MLPAAALQALSALSATAVFGVLNEVSGTGCFTDTLATVFIKLHVRPTESQFLEVRMV